MHNLMINIFCLFRKLSKKSQGPIFSRKNFKGKKKRRQRIWNEFCPSHRSHQLILWRASIPLHCPAWVGMKSLSGITKAPGGRCFLMQSDKCCSSFHISPRRGHILFQSSVFSQAPRRGLKLIISSQCTFKSELEKVDTLRDYLLA